MENISHPRTAPPLIFNYMSEGNKPNQEAWWQPALIMFARLSAWIAAPIIIALYLGKWLDRKFSSAPWLFLLCVGAAFLISMVGLVRNTLAEYKKIERLSKKK